MELLGLDSDDVKEIGLLYKRLNRDGMWRIAQVYDPNIKGFENNVMIEEAKKIEQEMNLEMSAFIRELQEKKSHSL